MTNGTVITTTDYAGNYIYQNDVLQMINQPEGYLEPNGQGSYDYGYRLKDHLGNIRLTFVDFDHNGGIVLSEITEENNYYPFGLKHQGYNFVVTSNTNAVAGKFKYNGKELNDELGLDLYDYGARFYDPALGRWHVMDPLAEKYHSWSPYNYAVNSPIRFLDPDGKYVSEFEDRFGDYRWGLGYPRWELEHKRDNGFPDPDEGSRMSAAEGDGGPDKKEGPVAQEGTKKGEKAQTDPSDKVVPFGGVMFYDEKGNLLYISGQGSMNKIYIIPDNNIKAVRKEINEFKSYWDQKRPSIGGKYSDPNYFQNVANLYSSNSYDPFVINGDVFCQKNIPWYTYIATAISVMGEGYVSGRRGIPIDRQYSVANYWQEQYTPKKFQPWW